MTTTARPREKLPPVPVTCTKPECGHRWTSRAKHQTVVRCPQCGRNIRVKRDQPATAKSTPQRQADSPKPVLYGNPVRPQPIPGASIPAVRPPIPAAAADDGQDDDDDGPTYMQDAAGRIVLADLTPDLRLFPVTLVDQKFRNGAPGQCSLYGCRGLARHMVGGWPVCPGCRLVLSSLSR